MEFFDKTRVWNVEQRDLHLTIFACSAIGILATGTAMLMYPVVFLHQTFSNERALMVAFWGFCGLSLLLAMYIWDRKAAIRNARRDLEDFHRRIAWKA